MIFTVASPASLLSFRDVAIDGFDEHTGGPWARCRAVAWVVIRRHSCRLDLVECRAGVAHRPHPIADDGDHVPVLDDLVLVADVPVAGDDHRAAFSLMLAHG